MKDFNEFFDVLMLNAFSGLVLDLLQVELQQLRDFPGHESLTELESLVFAVPLTRGLEIRVAAQIQDQAGQAPV